jgi:RHS repeat-associated protein
MAANGTLVLVRSRRLAIVLVVIVAAAASGLPGRIVQPPSVLAQCDTRPFGDVQAPALAVDAPAMVLAAARLPMPQTNDTRRERSELASAVRHDESWTLPRLSMGLPPLPATGNGLFGRYTFGFGQRAGLAEIDPTIDLAWSGVEPYNGDFTVIWIGYVEAPDDGNYTFNLSSVDYSALAIDGDLVIDLTSQGEHSDDETIYLTEGKHPISVYYYSSCIYEDASVKLEWTPPGAGSPVVVPQARLYAQVGPPDWQVFGPGGGEWTNDPTGKRAEPVNTATGNYFTQVTDLATPAPGIGFRLARTYNSGDSSVGVLGEGWRLSYDMRLTVDPGDGVATFHAADGSQLNFVPDGLGGFIALPGINAQLRQAYEGYDGFDGFELERKDGMRFQFDENGLITTEIDQHGNQMTFVYDGDELATLTDPVGREFAFTFTNGLLTMVSDPVERSVVYGYDVNDRLETVTDLNGGTTTYTYDEDGRLATIVDQNDHTVVTNTYDGETGRIASQLDARMEETTFEWDPLTQTSTMTDPRGGEWVDVYDNNLLVEVIDPLEHSTTFTYDAAFDRTSVTDPNENTTTLTYDGSGNKLTETAPGPLSYEQSWTYDDLSRVLSHTDGLGHTTNYDYNAEGDLLEIAFADETTITSTYLANGLLETSTDQRGKETAYDYDADWNLDEITSPLDEVTTMTYDAVGRMLTKVDGRGHALGADPADFTTHYEYDDLDRVTSINDPLEHETVIEYDPAGNRVSVTDANEHTTSYGYDAANHLTLVTDADAGETAYGYDDAGNLTSRTDANEHETTYEYDLAGRLDTTTDPLDHEWTLTYDDAGNVLTKTDANDKTTTFGYDELNRLTSITYDDNSTPPVTYAYDANGNRTAMTDGAGTETYGYDDLDRLAQVERGDDEFAYDYDPAGHITSREAPDGTTTAYEYDDDGRLQSSSTVSEPIDSKPEAPTDLVATLALDGTVDLDWAAPAETMGIVGYRVVRDDQGVLFTVDAGTTGATDWSAVPGLSYSYYVVSLDTAGNESDPSNVETGTIDDDDSRYQAEILSDTPAAYWRLGERSGTEIADIAGTNDGDLVQGYYLGGLGALSGDGNAAVSFDSESDGYASIPDSADLDLGNGPFSIELWAQVGEGEGVLLGKDDGTDGYRVAIDAAGRVVLATGDGDGNIRSEDPITDWQWHHIVLTRGSASDGEVYVDGVDVTEAVATGTFTDNSAALTLGAGTGGTANYVAGSLDELAIYDRKLTAQEVADHHEIGTTWDDTTVPSTPAALSATPSTTNTVELNWTGSSDDTGVQGYVVYRDAEFAGRSGTTTFVDTGLESEVEYTYTVSAVDGAGNESAQSASDAATAAGPGEPEAVTVTAAYAYDEAGNLLTETTGDGVVATYTYDEAGRLLEVANVTNTATLSRTTYQLDAVGNRVVATTTRGSQYYTYDQLNRLTGECYDVSCAGELDPVSCIACVGSPMSTPTATITPNSSDIETTYTYDPVGNRLTEVTYLGTTTYSYDAADRLTTLDPPDAVNRTYGYDDNGNQTVAGSNTFEWDLAGRLASATVDATTETYSYSGDGTRIDAERDGGDTTAFVVDRNFALPQVVGERDGQGASIRRYSYGAGVVAQTDGEGMVYLHRDGLGSITDVTSTSGESSSWRSFAAFGQIRATGMVEGTPQVGFAFTGQYHDLVTGTYHLRARQYDPMIGRLLSRDAVAQPVHEPYVAAYLYVGQRPTMYVDPSGKCWGPAILLLPACVGAGVYGLTTVAGNVFDNFQHGRPLGDDPLRGANAADLAISVVSAYAGGALGSLGGNAGRRIVGGMLIGCAATAASQAAGGRDDPFEVAIGCGAGALGEAKETGSEVAAFIYGAIVGTAQAVATVWEQATGTGGAQK